MKISREVKGRGKGGEGKTPFKTAAHGPGSCRTALIPLKQFEQESCAIAKMTAQRALHMGALKIFGTP